MIYEARAAITDRNRHWFPKDRIMPKKNNLIVPYSGFILTFEPARTQWLAQRLHPDIELKESFSALDTTFERRELVLLVLSREPVSISAIALMERMRGSGGTGKLKMLMPEMVVFDEPVAIDELNIANIAHAISTPETLRRTEPDIWTALIAEIKRLRPADADAIDDLISSRESERRLLGESPRVARLNEQRDGLGLSLDVARLDRAAVMRTVQADRIESAESILDLLDIIPIQERSLLEHDRRILELLLTTSPFQSAQFSDNNEKSVRVYIVDKTDLETVLGIDLVIYSTCYNSFLLLQYKRMEKNNEREWFYPIDVHMQSQLENMHAFHSAIPTTPKIPPSLWSYRLNEDPFYFKFCEQVRPSARDESLVPGIILCESHLREFITLPEAKGPRGGLSIGYLNCPRYLNNTEFVQLARFGWIGADQQSAALLQRVLGANKQGGRSAMLAVIDTPQVKTASQRGWR